MTNRVSATFEDGVATIHLNSPPVNAMNLEFVSDFEVAVETIEQRSEVAVILLMSDVPKVFSAGADAKWFAQILQEGGEHGFLETFKVFSQRLRSLMLRLHEGPWLSIAVLNGHAVAGGMELASACDLRFSPDNDDFVFSLPEASLFGAIPSGGGGTQYLESLIGRAATLDLIVSSAQLTPKEAYQLGWVNRLFPSDEFLKQVEHYVQRAISPPTKYAISTAKRSLRTLQGQPFTSAIMEEQGIFFDALDKIPFIDGVRGFAARYAHKEES